MGAWGKFVTLCKGNSVSWMSRTFVNPTLFTDLTGGRHIEIIYEMKNI
jgi:hypothetical protein